MSSTPSRDKPADDSFRVESTSPDQTQRLGEALAPLLPMGSVLALQGDLAAGKTCFVRGLAATLAPRAKVTSPTFTIVHEYCDDGPTIYHVDLYRLATVPEILDLGYEDLFKPEDGIAVIEWAERAEPLLPDRRLDIHFDHAGQDRRTITLTDRGLLPAGWRESLAQFR